jgi:aspartate ammonia-lyase
MRTEKDYTGICDIPDDALYGVHSLRARGNFPGDTRFSLHWYKATALVKLAVYNAYSRFAEATREKYSQNIPIHLMDNEVLDALRLVAAETAEGRYFDHFIVPALQGGAGTSINMNLNEIIANAALVKLGLRAGDYHRVDPVEHANIFQSTNDVIPTALKVALLKRMGVLEEQINALRHTIEGLESSHRNTLRIAYTQMQEAVPSSYGRLFSTYNDALSRDWWRVTRCRERLKVVNIGGSAIGSGLTVPRFMINETIKELQHLTGLPLTRSENMHDTTANNDSLVEAHAILKAHAVNLEKISSDIRMLASDLSAGKEISIPVRQVGSSIMPGKINPVIPEFVISSCHKVYANDQLISSLAAQGMLDLNAYLPAMGDALLQSVEMLINSCRSLQTNLFAGLTINAPLASERLFKSPAIATALLPYIGYNKAGELARVMKEEGVDIFVANEQLQLVEPEKLRAILSPEVLLKTGFLLNDIEP